MPQNLSHKLYGTEQIRALEHLAITAGLTGFELMTRAGEAAFDIIRGRWPTADTFAVFCGGGNNAGDGYVVAHLLLAAGLQVYVYSVGDAAGLKGDALLAYQAFIGAQGRARAFGGAEQAVADVMVDALLGTGLSGAVKDQYAAAIQTINASGKPVLSLDVPSGINADTGAVMGDAVHADCTVTFVGLKKGLLTGAAPDYTGEVLLAGLMLPEALLAQVAVAAGCVVHKPLPKRPRCAHKGSNGQVLIIGGACGYSGAALLAGQAALRVGSGLVSLATRPEHAGFLNLNCPELMCHAIDTAEQLLPLLAKASVVVIGPGLGQTLWAENLLAMALSTSKPLIIDADALNLLAQKAMPPGPHPNWIMTPHPGEAARLLSTTGLAVQQDRFAAVAALQACFGGMVVLKGAGTLIAGADGIMLSTTGNPGMGSGGMGDVLTGVIAGLCAQGLSMPEAAQQGVYIHGAAADRAAAVGERGMLASDLLPHLRQWVN